MAWVDELKRTPLFAAVPAAALQPLADRAVRRRYRAGSVVFAQGDRGTSCYAILSGSVKISTFTPDGREAVLAVLGPGDVFGELVLFDDAPRSADASAIEASELLSIDERDVNRVIANHPELGLALLAVMGRRLRRANEAFQDIAFFDVPARVARRLADLAEAHGKPTNEGIVIDVPLSQESLAHMVGSSRESVNKALAQLRRSDLVGRQGRRYVIRDVADLRASFG